MIYAIADLHLDYTEEKSMEVFGDKWKDYQKKIFANRQEIVKEEDTVLLPGDISRAMDLSEAEVDLKKIDSLKGKKIIMKGNHDYWWSSLKKISDLGLETISFLQNNSFEVEGYNICGTRGWMSESNSNFDDHDEKIYRRELMRLDNSFKSVRNDKPIIAILHYPPFGRDRKLNEFFYKCRDRGVKYLIYGHLHGVGHKLIIEGNIEGVELKCVAGDYIDFVPQRLV